MRQSTKPKCTQGYSCGSSCISKAKVCIGFVSAENAKYLLEAVAARQAPSKAQRGAAERAKTLALSGKTFTEAFAGQDMEYIGGGTSGKVYRLSDGLVVKYVDLANPADIAKEAAAQRMASLVGAAPKVYGVGKSWIAMDEVTPFPKARQDDRWDEADGAVGPEINELIGRLYSAGVTPADPHFGNIARDKSGKLVAIDFGQISKYNSLAMGMKIGWGEPAALAKQAIKNVQASDKFQKFTKTKAAQTVQGNDRLNRWLVASFDKEYRRLVGQ